MEATHDAPATSAVLRKRRALLPSFGLKSLLVFALLFCLLCGWIGRNAYRVRQEEAAVEALMQAQAAIVLESEEERELHPATPPLGNERVREDWQELVRRTLGLSERRLIREVILHGQDPDDKKLARALASLSVFPEIRQIDLRGPALNDKVMPHLAKLKRLERLEMSETTVTGAGLALLGRSVPLAELSISREASSAHVLAKIDAFLELKSLSLEELPISRADMDRIASLPKLQTLRLDLLQPTPGEEVFTPLAKAQRLRFFYESRSGMTEAELATLSRLPVLEEVWVGIATDANVPQLKSLPALKKIYFDGPVTVDGAKVFSAARPDVAVAYRIFNSDGRWFHAGKSEWD